MTFSTPILSEYAAVLADRKQQLRRARSTAQRQVTIELVALYWGLGRTIPHRHHDEGWESNLFGGLATDAR